MSNICAECGQPILGGQAWQMVLQEDEDLDAATYTHLQCSALVVLSPEDEG